MARIHEREDKTKHTIWLRRGDMDFLTSNFPNKASIIIRRLVSNFVDETKRGMADATQTVKESDLDV
jgi:hypothetical protein